MFNCEVWIKAENLQKTGSFKVRGAFNKLIRTGASRVAAASMGNHAQGVAYAAAKLGMQARIVMPVTTPLIKQEATRGYGAEVILHGSSFAEALALARSFNDFTFIHSFDDEEVIAGQGTGGLEIMEEKTGLDAVLVPVGGGGLIAGTAVAVKELSPGTEVIGIQTESAVSCYSSFRSGTLMESPVKPTIADGIAVERIGEKPFEIMHKYVDDIITVREESIARAVLLFLERKKLVVEGAGAVPVAALLENNERFRSKKIAVIASGGNIDFTLIDRIIHKGLASSGRIGSIKVVLSDTPGSLHRLTGIIAEHGGNILHISHNRLNEELTVGMTEVVLTLEAKGRPHLEEISESLLNAGFAVELLAHNEHT